LKFNPAHGSLICFDHGKQPTTRGRRGMFHLSGIVKGLVGDYTLALAVKSFFMLP